MPCTSLHQLARATIMACALLGAAACGPDVPTAATPPASLAARQRDVPEVAGTPLGSVAGGGRFIRAYAINDRGEVVGLGHRNQQPNPGRFAVQWSPREGARAIDAGDPGYYSVALDINDHGVIVGYRSLGDTLPDDALVWPRRGDMLVLNDQPRIRTLVAVNNHGVAVGRTDVGIVWSLSGWWYFRVSDVTDINDRGDIVGRLQFRPAVWPAHGDSVIIDTPITSVTAQATGVNNRGDVVGWHGTHDTPIGFRWSADAGLRALPAPNGWYARPEAINDRGEVAGTIVHRSQGNWIAVLWTETDALVQLGPTPAAPAQGNSEALDLNEMGQVVGYVEDTGVGGSSAFRWTVGRKRGR